MITATPHAKVTHPQRRKSSPVDCYEPSPETIRQQCRQIQSEWSEAERARRLAVPYVEWTVPRATEVL